MNAHRGPRGALDAVLCAAAFGLAACAPASAQCMRYEDYTHPVGTLELGELLYGVTVAGDFAYAVEYDFTATTTFHVIDISDPARPRLTGSTGLPSEIPPRGTAVIHGHVLLADSYADRLYLVDVSDPQGPRLSNAIEIEGAWDVAASGSYAYVAGTSFHVVDVSDPSNPRIVATLDIDPVSVALAGSYAFVGAGEAGMIVLELSNPLEPTIVSILPVPGEAGPISISAGCAYLIEYDDHDPYTLRVIDISDPRHPTLRGSVEALGETIASLGSLVFLTCGWQGVRVYDASDPDHPVFAEELSFPYWSATGVAVDPDPFPAPPRVFVSGTSTYDLISYDGWLHVHDVTPLHKALPQAGVEIPCPAIRLDVRGNSGCVAGGTTGLQLIDLSDPDHPAVAGAVDTPDYAGDVAIAGEIACVADRASGLQLVDVRDPLHPAILGGIDTPGEAVAVAASGGHAFVADRHAGLMVVDIADPSNPWIAGGVDTPGDARDVAILADHAYVADRGGGLQVADITDPSNPRIVGSVHLGVDLWSVDVSGTHAYVAAGWHGLVVIDVADPARPQAVGALAMPPWNVAGDLRASRHHVYLGADSGVLVIDVTDPAAPAIVGWMETGPSYGIAVGDSRVYLGDRQGSDDRFLGFSAQCEPTVGPGVHGPVTRMPGIMAAPWPNPMMNCTTVRLSLPGPGPARAGVWDVTGRLVRSLHDGILPGGMRDLVWDGRDAAGRPVPAGIYWIRLDGAARGAAHRLIVLR